MRSVSICVFGLWIYFSISDIGDGLPIPSNKVGTLSLSHNVESALNENDHVLSRHKRSSNETVDNRSDIEKFYADPNNKAMYLVLPLIVLVYGGCSSIYCVYKCRRYLKRQKEKRQMAKMKKSVASVKHPMSSSQSGEGTTSGSTSIGGPIQRTASTSTLLPNTIEDDAIVNDMTALYPKFQPVDVDYNRNNTERLPMEDLDNNQEIEDEPSLKQMESSFSTPTKVNSRPSSRPSSKESKKSLLAERTNRVSPIPFNDEKDKLKYNPSPLTYEPMNRADTGMKHPSPLAYEPMSRADTDIRHPTPRSPLVGMPRKKLPKVAKFSDLSDEDIKTIINYYSEKKHMPDVIPEDEENMAPIRKTAKKWKYRVFNA